MSGLDTITERDVNPKGLVELWYLGPERPRPPQQPQSPFPDEAVKFRNTGEAFLERPTTAEEDLALDRYSEAVHKYRRRDLPHYKRLRDEYDAWQENTGGPVKVLLWAVDAKILLERQAKGDLPTRYHKILPRNVRPGHLQREADRRAEIEAEQRQRDVERDPHFGAQAAE